MVPVTCRVTLSMASNRPKNAATFSLRSENRAKLNPGKPRPLPHRIPLICLSETISSYDRSYRRNTHVLRRTEGSSRPSDELPCRAIFTNLVVASEKKKGGRRGRKRRKKRMGMETNGRGSLPWKRSEGFLPRVRLYSLSLSLLRYQNKRERSRRKKKGIVGTSIFTRSLLSIQRSVSTIRSLFVSRRNRSCRRRRRVDRLAASSRTRPALFNVIGREAESTGFRSLFVKGARVRTTTFPTTVETL